MKLKIVYEDRDVIVVDKPPEIIVAPEGKIKEKTLIEYFIEQKPELKEVGTFPRYGLVHRLDKNTSGILLIAKNNKTLDFLQNEFKQRRVTKKYLALVVGKVKKENERIETLIGRSPKNRRKQKIYLSGDPKTESKREAKTHYEVLQRFKNYTLLEVKIKTGRKHQIRCHLSWKHHPIAGDKLYGFKKQPIPKNLKRQFLHAGYLKVGFPTEEKEFKSNLPKDLKEIIKELKENDN